MGGAEIINIVATIAIAQLCCDLAANSLSFKSDNYKRMVRHYERAEERHAALEKQHASGKLMGEKSVKRLEAAEKEKKQAAADVSKVHLIPQFFISILFLILYRIFATEYSGKLIGFVPFVPYKLVRRLSMRGLEMDHLVASTSTDTSNLLVDVKQSCSFLAIYMLSAFSVRFFVSRAVAIKPPKGAQGGIMAHMDAPENQKILKRFGLDEESYKMD